MNKKFLLSGALAFVSVLALTSCGDSGFNDTTGITVTEDKAIGFILPGTSGNEMRQFVSRWEELGKEYGIKILTKGFKGFDPAYYVTAANELIALGADAIVCNFEMDGKENIIETCIDERVYCAFSGSTVSEEIFNEYKEYPYFLGQIAPSPELEEEEAFKMTKYFLDMYYGPEKVEVPAGTTDKFAVWPVDFHGIDMEHQMTYRWKGVEKALKDYGVTIEGHEDADSFKWKAVYAVDSPLKDKLLILGNNLADQTLNARCKAELDKNPNTLIITSSANYLLNMFSAQNTFTKGTRFATIDSLNPDYLAWYKADEGDVAASYKVAHDPYLVGKYIAINSPVLDLCSRAFEGTPLRNPDGEAINVTQKYWRTTTLQEFEKAMTLSKEYKWDKEFLRTIKTEAELQALFDKTTLEYVDSQVNK